MTTQTEALGEAVIDGTVVVESTPQQMMHPPAVIPPTPPTLAVVPQVQAAELVERLNVIQAAADSAMKEGVDYGKVPGTDKPTLLKPGAEKLGVLFQLDVQIVNEKIWGPGDHLTVIAHATVFHAPTGARLGYGEGACTTREKKYGKRRRDRACPECGEHTILKSNHDPEWFCWRKKGGCGAKFNINDERLTRQEVGEVENPALPDTWNTVIKMAEKRARVDAVLAVTGASAIFTQDVEDQSSPEPEPERERQRPPQQTAAQTVPQMGQELFDELIATKQAARLPDTADSRAWMQQQLKAIGVDDPPERLTLGFLRRLTQSHGNALLEVLAEIVNKRDEQEAAEGAPA